jgi:hypothetical protein
MNVISTATGYLFPCLFRYYRLRCSVYSSGTVTAGAYLRKASNPIIPLLTYNGVSPSAAFNGNAWNILSTGIGTFTVANGDAAASLVTLSAAGASTINSSDLINQGGKYLNLGINLTTVTTATITINIQGKDVVSGQYYTILSSTGIVTTGFTLLSIGPGLTAAANSVANIPSLPKLLLILRQARQPSPRQARFGTAGQTIRLLRVRRLLLMSQALGRRVMERSKYNELAAVRSYRVGCCVANQRVYRWAISAALHHACKHSSAFPAN